MKTLDSLTGREVSPLWTGGVFPRSADIPALKGVTFHAIAQHCDAAGDGLWRLRVALAWHGGRLYATYGFNTGRENTATEQARACVSDDGGLTWGTHATIDGGKEQLGVSHGVLLSQDGALWGFQGAFQGDFQRTHTRAYVHDESRGRWDAQGVVVDDGFWPLQEPILNIARWHEPFALAASSADYGRTWSAATVTNVPMAPTKPYAGTLSTGEPYLIGTTTADCGTRRAPLTIALGRPCTPSFDRLFVIRHADCAAPGALSHPDASLCYPYAVEHDGALYVGYSIKNRQANELARIPLEALAAR